MCTKSDNHNSKVVDAVRVVLINKKEKEREYKVEIEEKIRQRRKELRCEEGVWR